MSISTAVTIQKGTLLDPTGSNISYIIGRNTSVSMLEVNSSSIQLNGTVLIVDVPGYNYTLNVTSFNYSDVRIDMRIEGSFPINVSSYVFNFTIYGLPAGSSLWRNDVAIQYNLTETFEVNLTNTSQLITIKNIQVAQLIFYDEVLDQLITQEVNYEIISSTSAANYSTSTGYSVIDLEPGDYTINYWSDGYNRRSYYLTQTDTPQSLELFLLNSTEATYVSFVIVDETGNFLEGAKLKALRYFLDCNCFKVVEMDLANFNGIAVLSLEQYDADYKFIVEYENTTVYASTAENGYKITGTTYTLTATLLGDTTESFFGTAGLYYNLSFSNATKFFYLTVNDPTNLVNQFCLYVDEMDATTSAGFTQRCSNCLNASSGSLACNVSAYIDSGHELVAKGWIHTNTQFSEYWLTPISWITDLTAVNSLGLLGVFLGFIFVMTGFFAGLVIAGLPGAIILFDVVFIAISVLKMLVISLPVMIGVIAVSFIVLVIVGDR